MIVLKCSGKPCRDLPTAEYRACHAVAIGRVLIGDEIALPGSAPDRVSADRPEIRVATEDRAIPEDDHTAGTAPHAVEHLDVNGIKSILHGGPVGDTFAIRRTWHNPAAGGVSKSRGTIGSVLWFSFCRKGVSLISNILSAREVYDEEQIEMRRSVCGG